MGLKLHMYRRRNVFTMFLKVPPILHQCSKRSKKVPLKFFFQSSNHTWTMKCVQTRKKVSYYPNVVFLVAWQFGLKCRAIEVIFPKKMTSFNVKHFFLLYIGMKLHMYRRRNLFTMFPQFFANAQNARKKFLRIFSKK